MCCHMAELGQEDDARLMRVISLYYFDVDDHVDCFTDFLALGRQHLVGMQKYQLRLLFCQHYQH